MTLRVRRIIMFSFIIAFFILAPLILFYSSGYRLDFKRYRVIKTGTLFIEAKDIKKADLYLNDEKREELFSEKQFIYNLLPGEFQIRMSKEGYHDWQKKAVVYSGLTTFIKDAILFKKEVPLQILDDKITDFIPAPDENNIAYINQGEEFKEIYTYNLADKQKKLLYRLSDQTSQIDLSWSASSKTILFSYSGNFLIIDVQDPKNIVSLKNIIDFTPDKIQWDVQSDNLLYALAQNAVYKIDLFNKVADKILEVADTDFNPDFYIDGNDIFYIEQAETQNSLIKYNLTYKTSKKILGLNKASTYKFLPSNNNYLTLIDRQSQKLYLIKKVNIDLNINNAITESIINFEAKDALWDNQEKQLLFYNDFEISNYNTTENKTQFINRYGQEIKKISWYPDLEHFVMLLENKLEIIDTTQEVGTRNTIEVVKFDRIDNFYLDRKGENIYFNGQIGNQQGLYQLKLK